MTSAPLERKVHQLDNDVQAIYELLSQIQIVTNRHDSRLREVARHLEAHDARFDALDARFDAVDGRFEGIEGQLGTVLELLRGR